MNILVTGANGQLGHEMQICAKNSNHKFVFTDVAEGYEKLDITNLDAIREKVKENDIQVIVNCAAVSTDYVFQGDKNIPCKEDWETNPLGVYGKTKLAGEKSIEATGCKHIIIRTAWLYSQWGKNFVKTMQNLTASHDTLKVVFDQVGTPTYAGDLAAVITHIIETNQLDKTGIYHFSNEGVCSWFDFAKIICELSGNTCDIQPCYSEEFPSPVKRPHFSVLDKSKLKQTFGFKVPYWTDSLKKCIAELAEAK